jgi:hypothetical protein
MMFVKEYKDGLPVGSAAGLVKIKLFTFEAPLIEKPVSPCCEASVVPDISRPTGIVQASPIIGELAQNSKRIDPIGVPKTPILKPKVCVATLPATELDTWSYLPFNKKLDAYERGAATMSNATLMSMLIIFRERSVVILRVFCIAAHIVNR